MNIEDRLNIIENNIKEEIPISENEEDDRVIFYDINMNPLAITVEELINFLISHNMH